MEHNEVELARQITLKQWDSWVAIKPWELLDLAWTKKEKATKAPNGNSLFFFVNNLVLSMTEFFNYLSGWVTTVILAAKTIKYRVNFYRKFIRLAYCFKQMGNFDGVMAIWSGLNRQPVYRLQKTLTVGINSFSNLFNVFRKF